MIPDFQTIMLPLMKLVSDGTEHSLRETIESLAIEFSLSDEERQALLPSGMQPVFHNRVGWARTYLKKAGLIESTRRGHFRITEAGLRALAQYPTKIDLRFLDQYPEFSAFRSARRETPVSSTEVTPDETVEAAYQTLRDNLAAELLDLVKKSPPSLFEALVIDLLLALGYGGSRKDAGEAIGRRGDEGIDGIIKEDRLGLDIIYIQAKRWEASVGRPEVQRFAGALMGQGAKKGVMLTTSSFSSDAKEYARRIDSKIILIEGRELAQLMIDHNIGVSPVRTYEVKKIDSDYFSE